MFERLLRFLKDIVNFMAKATTVRLFSTFQCEVLFCRTMLCLFVIDYKYKIFYVESFAVKVFYLTRNGELVQVSSYTPVYLKEIR